MQAEMLMQFIDGGLDIATMWPLFWPEGAADYNGNRYLMDPSDNYALSPSVDMFTMLSEAQGKNKYAATANVDRIYPLVVESTDKNTLMSYTHSKAQDGMWVSFKAPEYASVVLEILKPTSATDRSTGGTETMQAEDVTYDDAGGYYKYYLPAYSLGLLKLSK